jgi:hypothetical protein
MASDHHGEWGRVTAGRIEGGGGAAINCHKMQVKEGREGERSGAGAAGIAAAQGRGSKERKGRGEGEEEEVDKRARGVGDTEEKEKERRKAGRYEEGVSGPVGRKGKEVSLFFFFFFKLFSNQIFSIQIQTKPFKLFQGIL